MNRSRIEWCDHTWNPVTGCRHNCTYCYARRMTVRFSGNIRLNRMAKDDYETESARDGSGKIFILDKAMDNETGKPLVYPFGFEPTLHRYRFDFLGKLKMGNNVFVGAMADVFGEWVPDSWIKEVLDACIDNPQHNYLFLTKNPDRYSQYNLPKGLDNMWYGTSITKQDDMDRFNLLPAFCKTFVSMEPILEDLNPEIYATMFKPVGWIIIGAETGNRKNKVVPKFEWIKKIVNVADNQGIPVFMKDSLIDIVGEKNMRREYPPQLQRKVLSEKVKIKLYDACCECGAYLKKSDMIALLARSERGEMAKQYGFMCDKCFKISCKEHGLLVPQLNKWEEK